MHAILGPGLPLSDIILRAKMCKRFNNIHFGAIHGDEKLDMI